MILVDASSYTHVAYVSVNFVCDLISRTKNKISLIQLKVASERYHYSSVVVFEKPFKIYIKASGKYVINASRRFS